MAMRPPNSDSFGTFLETVSKRPARKGEAQQSGAASQSPAADVALQFKVLQAVRDGEEHALNSLMQEYDIDLFSMAAAVDALTKEDLIVKSGKPGQEEVRLTEKGRALTK